MGYFRELPNLEYPSPLLDRTSSLEYVTTKNLFNRIKIREDLQNNFTAFDKYQIQDGVRPDQVALELYDSENLDWVVLVSAGITNIRDQWPLSSKDIYKYAEFIYGNDLNNIHHYETKEIKDSTGRIILPKGNIVNRNFKSPKPTIDTEPNRSYIQFYDVGKKEMVKIFDITNEVTNYEYETRLNDKKRGIYVLKKQYLQQFLNDTRSVMIYPVSSQYVNEKLKRGENIRIKSP